MKLAIDSMLKEFREETPITRRVLERVPSGNLAWKPHPTSTPLGLLAMHVATIPGQFARVVQQYEVDLSTGGPELIQQPTAVDEIIGALDTSIGECEACLTQMTESTSNQRWRIRMGEKILISKPRIEVLRSTLLNHWYHHRGQLTVYLRMLAVPILSIYGPSGDENPFQ